MCTKVSWSVVSLNTSGAVGGNVAKTPAETSVVVAGRASLVVLKIKMDSFNSIPTIPG